MLTTFLNSHAFKLPLLTNNKRESKVVTSFWHPGCNSEKSLFITPNMLKEPSITIYIAINNNLCLLTQIKNVKWKLLKCLLFTNQSKYNCLVSVSFYTALLLSAWILSKTSALCLWSRYCLCAACSYRTWNHEAFIRASSCYHNISNFINLMFYLSALNVPI